MKAYKCYGINGYKESIYFTPRHGDAAPDEIEIYLQPYCNEAETFDGKKAIEYNGMLFFDNMISYQDNVLYIHCYNPGDAIGNPSGGVVAVGTVK